MDPLQDAHGGEFEDDDDEESSSSNDEGEENIMEPDASTEAEDDGEPELDDAQRQQYDVTQNVQHMYLSSFDPNSLTPIADPTVVTKSFVEPDPGTRLKIPIFLSSAVLLPEQTIPLNGHGLEIEIIQAAMDKPYPYVGLLTLDNSDDVLPSIDTGTLIQIHSIRFNSIGFSFVGSARQRFRLLKPIGYHQIQTGDLQNALFYVLDIDVEVLDDYVLPPVYYDPACAFNRLPRKTRKDYLKSVFATPATVLTSCTTEAVVESLKKWLCKWMEPRKIDNALAKGLPSFSFWAAVNLPITVQKKIEVLVEDSVDRRLRIALDWLQKMDMLECTCGSEKLHVSDLVNLSTESLANCYVNQYGYVHDMFTSSNLMNISFVGGPQTEFSWFPGYSWRITNCARCHCHIGWLFQSKTLKPAKFFGIVRSSIRPKNCEETFS